MTDREAIRHLTKLYDNLEEFFSQMGYHLKDEYTNARTLAIAALEQQEQNRWIPCSVRLPELESEVLVTDEYGEIRHADYSDWLGKAEFRTVEESMTLEEVKAWRPLPEPYQEEEA